MEVIDPSLQSQIFRGKCKEFIVSVAKDGKTVDIELDTGAF